MSDTDDRIKNLEDGQKDILRALNEISTKLSIGGSDAIVHAPGPNLGHAKPIIKKGMSDFYCGLSANPFSIDTVEHEYWQLGYDNARDTWADIKK